jgi:hypothetical protein
MLHIANVTAVPRGELPARCACRHDAAGVILSSASEPALSAPSGCLRCCTQRGSSTPPRRRCTGARRWGRALRGIPRGAAAHRRLETAPSGGYRSTPLGARTADRSSSAPTYSKLAEHRALARTRRAMDAYQQRERNPKASGQDQPSQRSCSAKESSHSCNRTAIRCPARSPPTASTGPRTSAKCGLSDPRRQIYTGDPTSKFPSKNPRKTGVSGASKEKRKSGRPDSNRGPRPPKGRALPGCATPRRALKSTATHCHPPSDGCLPDASPPPHLQPEHSPTPAHC